LPAPHGPESKIEVGRLMQRAEQGLESRRERDMAQRRIPTRACETLE
jgi:hypothetical protein